MSSKEPFTFEPDQPLSAGTPPFDPDKYLEHIADFDMTEAQKVAFLRTLWDIMATFVRLGFGVEHVLPAVFQEASGIEPNGLEEKIPTHEFNVAAEEQTDGKEE
jgi:hypothetical protein